MVVFSSFSATKDNCKCNTCHDLRNELIAEASRWLPSNKMFEIKTIQQVTTEEISPKRFDQIFSATFFFVWNLETLGKNCLKCQSRVFEYIGCVHLSLKKHEWAVLLNKIHLLERCNITKTRSIQRTQTPPRLWPLTLSCDLGRKSRSKRLKSLDVAYCIVSWYQVWCLWV